MRGIVLAASHEKRHESSIKVVPLPLVDLIGEKYLTTLYRRLGALSGMSEVLVVTNGVLYPLIEAWTQEGWTKQDWAKELADRGVSLRVINDETDSRETQLGAVGDLVLALKTAGWDEDVVIVGGDNWFTYDLEAFVNASLNRSPAVVVTRVSPGPRPSRFGWVEMASEGRITQFLEHPESADSSQYFKASCVYYLSRQDLSWLKTFDDSQSTKCSPGTFFAWLAERTDVFGMEMAGKWRGESRSRGPDALEFRDRVRKYVNPRDSTWQKKAAQELEWATSHADLVDALEDPDPNKRIVAAQLLGYAGQRDDKGQELLSQDGLATVICALVRHLNDEATNLTDETWQSDEDERPDTVSKTAARSLVNLGYAKTTDEVFAKAKASGT